MPSRPSFAARAVLAVALTVGFYLLAAALVFALVWIPWAEVRYLNRLDLRILAACLIAAGTIAWAIFPRRDRFVAPGPELDEAGQPRLFAELRAIAAATGQPLPATVYLVNDLNAWVAERGGWQGAGARRVMGLGWPLLQLLSVDEFRGVVAHEFGHYHGGDTRLGPWVYRTRAAIARTLAGLQKSLMRTPFLWYGRMFLRLTHAMSRAQEYAADAVAAGIVGPEAMVTGLQRLHVAGGDFHAYWFSDVTPALKAKRRPPLLAGFASQLRGRDLSEAGLAKAAGELKAARSDPYDTHPSLAERVAALRALPAAPASASAAGPAASARRAPAADDRAIVLLDDPDTLERRLLDELLGSLVAAGLKPMTWDDAGVEVHLPRWREAVVEHARALRGVRAADLPAVARDLRPFLLKFMPTTANPDLVEYESLSRYADQVVTAAIIVAMHRAGAAIRCVPGEPVSISRGDATFSWSSVLLDLAAGRLDEAAWRETCRKFGIGALDLGAVEGGAQAVPPTAGKEPFAGDR